MTVWARSDVAAITISPVHGGCGKTHSRPAPGGKPVPVWDLTCHGGCEDFLRHDSLWSATPGTIPETPDETQARESAEGRTQRDQLLTNIDALTAIANGQRTLPADLGNALAAALAPLLAQLAGVPAADTQAPLTAPQPDPVVDDTPAVIADPADPARAIVLPQGENADLTPNQLSELQDAVNTMNDDPAWRHHHQARPPMPESLGSPDLDTMGLPALNDFAKSLGLPGRRSKADQIEAIRAHLNQ